MNGQTVVFDLDGTLVDTAPDLIDTLNRVFEAEGIAAVPFVEARALIGAGAKRMIERGLQLRNAHCSPAEVARLYQDYIGRYADHIADRSRPFPGVERALDQLAGRGCRLAVCTNKLEWLAVRLLDAFGLTGRFAVVCGPDTFGVHKPDPQVLHRTIAAAGGGTAVMVGDSETDIATARAAGVPVIAVDFGYTETPVAQLAPDRVISHFDDLGAALDGLRSPPA